MVWARIRVGWEVGGGLQALWGAPLAAYSGCGEGDGRIGHGKRRSRTGLARVCGDVQFAGTLGQWRTGTVRLSLFSTVIPNPVLFCANFSTGAAL